MTTEIWMTATITVETQNGTRFQGISYVGDATDRFDRLPKNANVRYTSRLRRQANDAHELARTRTIHHNVWHDGTAEAARIAHLHSGIQCPER